MATLVCFHAHPDDEAITTHRSQVTDSRLLLEMSSELFALAFGTEWFVERDRPGPMRPGWIFDPA